MAFPIGLAMAGMGALGSMFGSKPDPNQNRNFMEDFWNNPGGVGTTYRDPTQRFYQSSPERDMLDLYIKQSMAPMFGGSNVKDWKNPYQGRMDQAFSNMANAPTAKGGAQDWMSQFGGMFNPYQLPGVQRGQLPGGTQNFLGMNPQQMQFNPASLGLGGDIMSRIAGGNMPGAASFSPFDLGQTQGARTQQLSGLQGLMNQPGMTPEQISTIAQGAFNPVADMLKQREAESLSGLSARGGGRSSGYGQIRGDTSRELANQYGGLLGGLTQQNVGLTNQNRLAALQGLGDFTSQGLQSEGIGLQGQNQLANFLLGQGGLAGQLAGMTQSGQQVANQQNLAGQGQYFNQLGQQAGLGANLYESDSDRYLREALGMGQLGQSGSMNQQDNMMRLLGMGAGASAQDFGQQSDLMGRLLGAGGLNQQGWSTAQGDRIQEELGRGSLNLQGRGQGMDLSRYLFDQGFNDPYRWAALQQGGYAGSMGGGGQQGASQGDFFSSLIPTGIDLYLNRNRGGSSAAGGNPGGYWNPFSMYGGR